MRRLHASANRTEPVPSKRPQDTVGKPPFRGLGSVARCRAGARHTAVGGASWPDGLALTQRVGASNAARRGQDGRAIVPFAPGLEAHGGIAAWRQRQLEQCLLRRNALLELAAIDSIG